MNNQPNDNSLLLVNQLLVQLLNRMASSSSSSSSQHNAESHESGSTRPTAPSLQALVTELSRMQSSSAAVVSARNTGIFNHQRRITTATEPSVLLFLLATILAQSQNGPSSLPTTPTTTNQNNNIYQILLQGLLRDQNALQNQLQFFCFAIAALQRLRTPTNNEQQPQNLLSLLPHSLLSGIHHPVRNDSNVHSHQIQPNIEGSISHPPVANLLQGIASPAGAAPAAPALEATAGGSPEGLQHLMLVLNQLIRSGQAPSPGAATPAMAQSALSSQIFGQQLADIAARLHTVNNIQQANDVPAFPTDTVDQPRQNGVVPDSTTANNVTSNGAPLVAAAAIDQESEETVPSSSQVQGDDLPTDGRQETKLQFLESFFPHKLHRLVTKLESEGKGDIVSFLDEGGVWVKDRRTFVKEIMPLYFRGSSWSSFRRQLYSYRFPAVTEPRNIKGAFRNPFFLRGRPGLCYKVTRDEKDSKKS